MLCVLSRMLKDLGLTVAVTESQHIGRQATGKSTAKVTAQHGLLYQTLVDKFDLREARRYADAQQSGLALIRHLITRWQLDCDLENVPAWIFTQDSNKVADIEREVDIARQLGLPAALDAD